ncbi:DUF805 domain-containing protein [Nitratireductor sp. XY-223]|uniref:DUF805 domain-containing protein n=1 Tax=Nitratireductor sp. XY-223 TaxID=2561926 RepID=UPI0010AA9EB9|nr:DUF805 domain-containing protein [Nitratireductor sp. XY-223]
MGFQDAVRVCLREKYITFSGRAPRSEFWYFMLFNLLVMLAFFVLVLVFGGFGSLVSGDTNALFSGGIAIIGVLFFLYWLAVILPSIAVVVRRFHDVNISGWWYLGCVVGGFIPYVGFLATLAPYVIAVIKGTEGDNKYGPDPLVERHAADVFA